MAQKKSMDLKKLNSFALKEHLKKKNWEKIEELLPAAEQFGVSGRLLLKTWTELGSHEKVKGNLVSALVSFAAARKHDVGSIELFAEITECINGFIDHFEKSFSKEDLAILQYSYDRIYSFYQSKHKRNEIELLSAKELLTRINSLLIFAPSKKETPASSNVQRIYAALYPANMPTEEIREEFARIFATGLRDEYDKRVKEKKKEKKKPSSAGGKKPPKKGDDDSTNDESNKDDDNKKPLKK